MSGFVHSTDSDRAPTQTTASLWKWAPAIGAFFVAFSTFLTYDEIRLPGSIPLKSTNVATVPLFNAWTIGWNANRAVHGFENYWDAPIFFPADQPFAFSEPQPATLLVAPVCWITGSAVAGYKVWLFLSLALNGFFTALLLRRLGHGVFLQMAGGTAMTLLPVVHQQIDVLQLVPVWGIIWFWSSLFELDKHPGPRTSVETGVAYAMCFALSVHHSLFLSLAFPFAAVVFIRRIPDRRFLKAALLSMAVASVFVLPIVYPIHAAAVANDFSRKELTVKHQSAKLEQYLATPSNSLIRFDKFEASTNRRFNVGWFRMSLAVFGATTALIWGARRRWALFLVLTVASAVAFSLGLNFELFGWQPWQSLSENLPGFSQVRNVFRFVWLVQISIVLLATEGLAAVLAICQRRVPASLVKPALAIFVVIPGALLAAEVWPETAQRGGAPDVRRHRGWTHFIRDNRTADRPIVCLPFASGNSIADFDVTTRWMLYSLEHDAPMLNGYSGFFPKSYFEIRNFVNAEFPSAEILKRFDKLDVEFVVVARKYCDPERLLGVSNNMLQLVYEDAVGVDVYRMDSSP